MDHTFLMIVLTLSGGGQPAAAFVNTRTIEECEQRASVVRGILDKGDTEIKQIICRSSDAKFEPFAHGEGDDSQRNVYLISFDAENATVEPAANCDAADTTEGARYCATSTQKLLSQAQ